MYDYYRSGFRKRFFSECSFLSWSIFSLALRDRLRFWRRIFSYLFSSSDSLPRMSDSILSARILLARNRFSACRFSLSTSNLVDTAGANGGKLSAVLTLKITDGTNTVYTGPINAVGTVQLPNTFLPSVFPWPAAAAHTYTFTVTFPDGGTPATATTGDNAYKGSSMTMQFDWTAVS